MRGRAAGAERILTSLSFVTCICTYVQLPPARTIRADVFGSPERPALRSVLGSHDFAVRSKFSMSLATLSLLRCFIMIESENTTALKMPYARMIVIVLPHWRGPITNM